MCGPHAAPVGLTPETPPKDRAADAYRRAMELILDARYDEARLALDVARQGLPRIADRIALQTARLELLRSREKNATDFFAQAATSIHDSIGVEARSGYVLALLRSDDPAAAEALEDLLWTYPSLPSRDELLFERARSLNRESRNDEALQILHGIRVDAPGSLFAPRAEAELVRLDALGHEAPTVGDDDQVKIARNLVRTGPLDRAKKVVSDLLEAPLADVHLADIHYLAGRLARYEGRWQAAEAFLRTAQGHPIDDPKLARELEDRAKDMAAAAAAREADAARVAISTILGRRTLGELPSSRLVDIIEVAAPAGLCSEVDRVLATLLARSDVRSGTLFDAVMAAVGAGNENLVAGVLGQIAKRGESRYEAAALYHLARSYERGGLFELARASYTAALESDDGYYALWAANGRARLGGETQAGASEGFAEPEQTAAPKPPQPAIISLAEQLEPIAVRHASAYPWFGRAADLLRIGDRDAASSELFESYLSWRAALGKPVARAGLDSVARNAGRTPVAMSPEVRESLLTLTAGDLSTLTEVAAAIGDMGTAGGFGGTEFIESLPRAYEWLVVPAAATYGLDPNLLLAVMRVESAYQQHIVSYAGAVGLMQIMPRTGQLIAHALGDDRFSPADLLDPKTNIEFAAWYLTSLIRRFDGHLPLAVAAYNAGPHNVRRWIQQSPDDATVDVLLERIPFTQTHRYVRRVLVYHQAYRAQQGLSSQRLAVDLPAPRVDPLSF